MKTLSVIGSTGSIGVQTLEVAYERGYRVAGLAAGKSADQSSDDQGHQHVQLAQTQHAQQQNGDDNRIETGRIVRIKMGRL